MSEAISNRVSIELSVNGERVCADVEPGTLLVELLRDHLGLTGTHVGCDTSQCGCCVVQVDGMALKSCTLLALSAQGTEVVTIEGLASGEALHPMQKAFHECHGLQCGYCTPGMIMAAKSLIDHDPEPSEEAIRIGLSGNLCRCTGYTKVFQAVQEAASIMRSEGMRSEGDEQ